LITLWIDRKLPGPLEALAKQLDIKIIPFDYNTVDTQIRSNPAVLQSAQAGGKCTAFPSTSFAIWVNLSSRALPADEGQK